MTRFLSTLILTLLIAALFCGHAPAANPADATYHGITETEIDEYKYIEVGVGDTLYGSVQATVRRSVDHGDTWAAWRSFSSEIASIFIDSGGFVYLTFSSNDASQPLILMPVTLTVVSDATPVTDMPLAFRLGNAIPNPFNPTTTLRFSLPTAGHTVLSLYNVQGRLVRTLVDEHRVAGTHEVSWQGHDDRGRQVPSGTYYARLVAGNQISVKPLVLVK